MGDEAQGEGSGGVATQESTVPEEVLDQWNTLGDETTPRDESAAGSDTGAATTAQANAAQNAKTPETPAAPANAPTPAPAPANVPAVWTPSAQQLHALQRAGLTAEELQTLPDKGQGVTEKLEKSWRDLGARWAQLGQAQGAQGSASPATNAQAAHAAPALANSPAPEAGIDFGIDPKVWGEDGAKAMTSVMQKAVTPFIERINRLEGQARQRENDALRQQVTTKFDGWAKEYDAYGDAKGDHQKLTPAQRETRQKVCVLADRIMTGAAVDGVTLSAEDALAQAHEALTADFRVQKQRETIAAQVDKRKKQFGTRPVSRSAGSQANPESAAAEAWDEGMKSLEAA